MKAVGVEVPVLFKIHVAAMVLGAMKIMVTVRDVLVIPAGVAAIVPNVAVMEAGMVHLVHVIRDMMAVIVR